MAGDTLRKEDELRVSDHIKEHRRVSEVIAGSFAHPIVRASVYGIFFLMTLFAPSLWWLVIILFFLVQAIRTDGFENTGLPLNIPAHYEGLDPREPSPGGDGYEKASGYFYMGVCVKTKEQLWLSFSNILRHVFVLGTTGSGKTVMMLSMVANFISISSGVIFTDAKGAPDAGWMVFSLARFFGRDDDYLLKNYLKPGSGRIPKTVERFSNHFAPFSSGPAEQNTQTIVTLMSEDKGGSGNKVFSEGGVSLVSAVMVALCELRDKQYLFISPGLLRNYLNYGPFCELLNDPRLSTRAKEALSQFMRSRSSFDDSKDLDKQPDEVRRQFGFNQAYFVRCLSALADSYDYVFMHSTGEINYRDVILQDRILVTLLPTVSKSPEEVGYLGKIGLAAGKEALSTGLGDEFEGEIDEVIGSLPTNSDRPFGYFNDEYAYIVVDGFSVTAAQARGFNVVMVFGAQDIDGIKRGSDAEAGQIVENTRIKTVMASEGGGDTMGMLQKITGEAYVNLTSGKQIGDWGVGYQDKLETGLQKLNRLDVKDLRGLAQGEGYMIFMDTLVRCYVFWHGITNEKMSQSLRIGRKPHTDYRPKRGGYSIVLNSRLKTTRESVSEWLNNIEPEPLLLSTESEHRLTKKAKAWFAEERQLPQGTDSGMALLTHLFDGASQKTSKSTSDMQEKRGVLASLGGTFGQDDGDAGEIAQVMSQTVCIVSDDGQEFVDTTYDNDMAFDAHIDGAFSDKEEITVTDRAIVAEPPVNASSILSSAKKNIIAAGMIQIEKACGSNEESAKEAAQKTADAAEKAVEFPTDPTPKIDDITRPEFKSMVDMFVQKSKRDDSEK